MQFPPEFESGDGEGMDMQLPNKVYNKLKAHSLSETKRGTRHSEKKEHSTAVCTLSLQRAVHHTLKLITFQIFKTLSKFSFPVHSSEILSLGVCG